MGIDAIALVRIRAEVIFEALPVHQAGQGMLEGRNGQPLLVRGLRDGTLVFTAARFSSQPDELGLFVRHLLGELLDRHDDDRGIYVLPDVASPRALSYEQLIDEIGDAGFWVPLVGADYVPDRLQHAEPGSFWALVGSVMSGMPSDALMDLQPAVSSGDMGSLTSMTAQLQQALAGREGELLGALQQSLETAKAAAKHGALESGETPESSVVSEAGELPDPTAVSDDEMAQFLAQALRKAEDLLQQHPALRMELESQLGLTASGSAEADGIEDSQEPPSEPGTADSEPSDDS